MGRVLLCSSWLVSYLPLWARLWSEAGKLQSRLRKSELHSRITYFSIFGRGAAGLWTNTSALGRFVFFGLAAALVLFLVLAVAAARGTTRGFFRDRRLLFLLIWMAPSILFYAFIHVGEYGYVFSFLPPLLLLLCRPLVLLNAKRRRALAAALVAANLLLFLVLTPPLSANRLAARDDILRSKVDTIAADFRPDSTLIISVFDYQQVRYYLPQFRSWTFDPSVERQPALALAPGIQDVIIFDNYLSPADPAALKLQLDREQTLDDLKRGSAATVRIDWDQRKVYLDE